MSSGFLDEMKKRIPGIDTAAQEEEKRLEREQRIERASRDFTFFCRHYLKDYFFCDPAEYQTTLYDIIQTRELTEQQAKQLGRLTPAIFRSTFKPAKDIKGIVDVEPRGHGKSTRMTFAFPLWCLIFKKAYYIIIIGASGDQGVEQLDNIKYAIEENDLIIEDFGQLHKPNSGMTWTSSYLQLDNGTAIQAKGKGGSLRGARNKQHRPDMVIVDDVFKDMEAESQKLRDAVDKWFRRTVLPLGSDALFIVVNTITNEDDLPSRLMKDIIAGKMENWIGLRFSAECPPEEGEEHGKPLWPQRYSWEELKKIQNRLGTLAYAQEYLSQPLSDEDRLFKAAWIQKVRKADMPSGMKIFGGIDPATGAHDQSALVTIGVEKGNGSRVYVLSSSGKTESTSKFTRRIIESFKFYKHKRLFMETVQFQAVYKDQILKDARDEGVTLPIRGVSPGRASKTVRLMSLSPLVENGLLVFGPGNEQLIDQLVGYPAAGFDDLCDALYYAVRASEKGSASYVAADVSNDEYKRNWRKLAKL